MSLGSEQNSQIKDKQLQNCLQDNYHLLDSITYFIPSANVACRKQKHRLDCVIAFVWDLYNHNNFAYLSDKKILSYWLEDGSSILYPNVFRELDNRANYLGNTAYTSFTASFGRLFRWEYLDWVEKELVFFISSKHKYITGDY